MSIVLDPSWAASSGFLMACLESSKGAYAGDANMIGMNVHKDVAFTENSNVLFPDQLINTLAHNRDHALGQDFFDFRWSKELYLEMDPMFLGMAVVANPTGGGIVAGTADTYKAATAFGAASGTFSATTQPTKGQKLVITLVTSGAAAIVAGASLYIQGTDLNGATIRERIVGSTYTQAISTNAQFVTQQGFASISAAGIVWTGMPIDCTIAVQSKTPKTRVYSSGLGAPALQTASFVHFDGGYTREYVGACLSQLAFSGALNGAVTMDATGYCNPLNALTDSTPALAAATAAGNNGNPDVTVTPGTAAPLYVAPALDQPEMGWRTAIYIDDPGNDPGSSQYYDLESWRWTIATGLSRLPTAVNSRLYSKIKRAKRLHTAEFTVDFATRYEWQRARTATKRIIRIVLQGDAITNTAYRTVTIDLPFVYSAFPVSASSDNTQLQLSGQSEYDPALGFDCQVTVVNSVTAAGGGDAYAAANHG